MLDIIHQNGSQKFLAGVYFVDREEIKAEEGKEEEEAKEVFNIVLYIEGLGTVKVAQYDSLDIAYAIFAHMVKLEHVGGLAILPPDKPENIQTFLASETGWALYK